ncbi:cyclic nucleotide-binding domain-containing protein [uncultured Tateyamaria sp.]|uniref:cyclic nucleotide-binding domain-containing protein n=1 Tax=uncultured Tateyamaria sp. TaxID=455651 RepID=UPI00261C2203|nr:cyclic nucleotide-binding domain-containing protein [uncultured Tateyamaria sp.]
MLTDYVAPEVVILLAGGAFTIGYLIINQIVLRLMILLGTSLYIYYYFTAADTPLWEAIYISMVMGTANLIGLGGLLWQQSKLAVPHAHRDIYPLFSSLPPGDFRDLVLRAERKVLEAPMQVTTEGVEPDTLIFVISGQIDVVKRGERFSMPPNLFVGEVAYLTQQPSAATTRLPAGAEVLIWDVAALRARAEKKSRFKLAIEAMISSDLAVKVAFAVAPHHHEWAEDAEARRVARR